MVRQPALAELQCADETAVHDEIGVAGCLMSLVHAVREGTEPSYGPLQARLDQAITLAIRQSSLEGGRPVQVP